MIACSAFAELLLLLLTTSIASVVSLPMGMAAALIAQDLICGSPVLWWGGASQC